MPDCGEQSKMQPLRNFSCKTSQGCDDLTSACWKSNVAMCWLRGFVSLHWHLVLAVISITEHNIP